MKKLSRLVKVRDGNGMKGNSWVLGQNIRSFMDSHVIDATLERTKQAMIKLGNLNCLIHQYVIPVLFLGGCKPGHQRRSGTSCFLKLDHSREY